MYSSQANQRGQASSVGVARMNARCSANAVSAEKSRPSRTGHNKPHAIIMTSGSLQLSTLDPENPNLFGIDRPISGTFKPNKTSFVFSFIHFHRVCASQRPQHNEEGRVAPVQSPSWRVSPSELGDELQACCPCAQCAHQDLLQRSPVDEHAPCLSWDNPWL